MLQSPGISNSGDPDIISPSAAATATATAAADLGSSGFSEDERGRIDDSGRSSGGNRWPRQETLALLKIRSDMDAAFRDSSLKAPLWDEVSRKLAELGYHRSSKKCKEKFENVYKYHKRTKEGRTSKADGKTYRFFDQLEALETTTGATAAGIHLHHHPPFALPPPPVITPASNSSPMPITQNTQTGSIPISNNVDPISVAAPAPAMMNVNHMGGFQFSQLNISGSTNSSSSSTSSDELELPERRRSRKRKWKEFFGKMMKEVIEKQEELQSKFFETLERRERDRVAREEAWRMQEMAKIKREHELLQQERSVVAAKDAAVVNFLQKLSDQNPNVVIPQISNMQLLHQQHHHPPPPPPPPPPAPSPAPSSTMQQQPPPPPPPSLQQQQHQATPPSSAIPVPVSVPVPVSAPSQHVQPGHAMVVQNQESVLQPSPSRWPKAEINALINLRTTLDTKYQESGPKGPLWEEISSAMRKLGYNRNAKRCKEKWENINKYYKKVKESSKKRPEDSKTCPYFHQLDAIYSKKAVGIGIGSSGFAGKSETQIAAPIMARPEQQWPLPAIVHQQQQNQQPQEQKHDDEQVKLNEQDDDDYDDEEDDDEEEDEEDQGGEYEIVPNKTSSMAAVE